MSGMGVAAKAIHDAITERLSRVVPQRATVQSIGGGRVTVRRLIATQDDATAYARLVVPSKYLAGDDVLLLPLGGEPVVIGRIQNAAPATPTISVNTAVAGSGAAATITGSDRLGEIEITTGASGLASGTLCTVTFARPRPDTNFAIWPQPSTNASDDLGGRYHPTSRTVNGWSLNLRVAPSPSSVYRFFYRVEEYEG